ncbi:MAG: hypothetical protein J6K62_02285 [Clostridia bacterium]|nr:hypothetical protein [Clostridia bacterium]MBQ4320153.1 hypothetical protein [Clostridia bacterium]
MSTNTISVNNTTAIKSGSDTVTLIRHYLPAVATLGWIIGFTLGSIPFFETLGIILCAIGIVAALTICPLKMLKVPLLFAAKGFSVCRAFIPVYGVADLCAAIFGFTGGAILGLIAVCGFPVFFTLRKLKASKA